MLAFGLIEPEVSLLLLAIWETTIGLLLIAGYSRLLIKIVLVHMTLTFSPLILLPNASFTSAPLALTLAIPKPQNKLD